MRMPLSEFKARVALYFAPEDLLDLLNIDSETFVDLIEEELWRKRHMLIEEMGLGEYLDDENE